MTIILPIVSLFLCLAALNWQRQHEPDRALEICYIALGINALVLLAVRWLEIKQGYVTGLGPLVSFLGLGLVAGMIVVRWMKG